MTKKGVFSIDFIFPFDIICSRPVPWWLAGEERTLKATGEVKEEKYLDYLARFQTAILYTPSSSVNCMSASALASPALKVANCKGGGSVLEVSFRMSLKCDVCGPNTFGNITIFIIGNQGKKRLMVGSVMEDTQVEKIFQRRTMKLKR